MDFVFDLPIDLHGNTAIVVFVGLSSKMARLEAVPESIVGQGTAQLLFDRLSRQHDLHVAIVVDRDPRFTSKF